MPTPSTLLDSQGLEFKYNGSKMIAKNVKVKTAHPTVEVTSLAVASGEGRVFQAAPLPDAATVSLEFMIDDETSAPAKGQKYLIVCEKLGVMESDNVYAFCEDSEITAAVGEMLAGTASFKITNNDVDLRTTDA
jgi:hypothetical protein